MSIAKIAIFASGQGSNALEVIRHLKGNPQIGVDFVLSNKEDAPVLKEAEKLGVATLHFPNAQVENGTFLTELCRSRDIGFIVLAGYLRKIPADLIRHYPERIINLHPALLPKYGGSGMYGMFVHSAVKEAQEAETGITIHYVDEEFDSGRILAQFRCSIHPGDEPEDIRKKVQLLEHAYFPVVIEKTILNHGHV